MKSKYFHAEPLSVRAYAAYGDVLSAAEGGQATPANGGTAAMYQHLSEVRNLRDQHAEANWKIYRCQPNLHRPVPVTELEKHPHSAQLFAPMGTAGKYLVVVAEGGVQPDLTTLRAFIASPQQAITYHPGIWHLPMTVLDCESDMLSLVYEDGSGEDCVVWRFDAPQFVKI